MPRKKAKEGALLQHIIHARVNDAKFKQLTELAKKATNGSTSDLLRDILNRRQIIVKTVDNTLAEYMPELIRLRKEINAIGTNINQVTRYFNQCPEETKKIFFAARVAGLFEKSASKSGEVLLLIEKLGERWLQK